MNASAERAMNELVAWKAASVRLEFAEHMGRPAATCGSGTSVILHHTGLCTLGVYLQDGEMEKEPEFQAALAKVQEAIKGLHEARECIIQRKAIELATLIHGDKLNGIRALVDQIQEGDRG